MTTARSTICPPMHPPGSQILYRVPPNDCTTLDRCLVWASSIFLVGSAFWVPAFYAWAWKKLRSIPKEQRKRRAIYTAILISTTALAAFGPHRSARMGKWLRVKEWRVWKAWMKFVAFEVVADRPLPKSLKTDQAILAVVPHGIFPFSLALTVVSDVAEKILGDYRVVIAPATQMMPFVRDILTWLNPVSASRVAVDRALAKGERIAICPGGIAEIFEGYPKKGCLPDTEYAILGKGILRMSKRYNVPIIPTYCFGGTKMLRRVQLPAIVEKISLMLRTSLVLFYGQCGLPAPFRQKLLYIMGNPIYPSPDETAEQMQHRFCDEIHRIFERHKESYGWGHKSLEMIKR